MIYLDNNATTRIDPEVLEAMRPFQEQEYANPSSPYTFARKAALAVQSARGQVAALVGASAEEIHFTSGGTEANNAALNHLLATGGTTALALSCVEHASVRNYALHRRQDTLRVEQLGVDVRGNLLPGAPVVAAGQPLALMWANNETGVIFPVSEFTRDWRVHTDLVQAAGKLPVSLRFSGVETAALSAHKIHGPKGIGAIYVRAGVSFTPLLVGGDQEQGVRAGTENVAGIVGFGKAAELALRHLGRMGSEIRELRDGFEERVAREIPDLVVAGRAAPRLPNTSMLIVPGCETEALLALLDLQGICVSSGSACAAGANEPSHVLRAMGLPAGPGAATLRVSLSRFSTREELDSLSAALVPAVRRLRGAGARTS